MGMQVISREVANGGLGEGYAGLSLLSLLSFSKCKFVSKQKNLNINFTPKIPE